MNNPHSSFSELGPTDLGSINNLRPSVSRMNNLGPNLTTEYLNSPASSQPPDCSKSNDGLKADARSIVDVDS